MSGDETLVVSTSVRWRATLKFSWLSRKHADRTLAWRSIGDRLRGRSRTMLIGPFDRLSPARLVAEPPTLASEFSDGSVYSDLTETVQSSRIAALLAPASLRDTQIEIAAIDDWAPLAGQYFGPEPGRLHRISALWPTDLGWSCEITPPLRSPLAVGAPLDFENPTCRMRLTADDGARLSLPWAGAVAPSLDLEEVIRGAS